MFVHATKNKLANSTLKKIRAQYDIDMSSYMTKEDVYETIKTTDRDVFVLRNGVPVFLHTKDRYIPMVKCVHAVPEIAKKVVVDVGAIKHLINGADVMAPGLLQETSEYANVEEDEIVAVYGHGKTHALGVGVAVMSTAQVEQERTGIAIKMINYLGDKIYNAERV